MPILGYKLGYIDKNGIVVIPPQFDCCYEYTEGLAAVKIDEKFGFIDKNGHFAIPPQFEWALGFSDGLAAVPIAGKCGYIDTSGTVVIPPTFKEVTEFSDGLAYVETETQKGYIDTTGAWAFIPPPHYVCFAPFCEGLAVAGVCEEDELNDDGYLTDWGNTGEGYIDKTGAIVIPPQFREVDDFSDGLAHVQVKDGDYVFINKVGDMAVKFDFDYESDQPYFSEGLVSVKIDGKYGFADKMGRIVIEPQFEEAYRFSEGLAAACIREGWGYIDKTGGWVIEPRDYWNAYNFSDGLALVVAVPE